MTSALATKEESITKLPTESELDALPIAEQALAEHAAITNLDWMQKVGFLEIGARLNRFYKKELWKHLPEELRTSEFSEYLKKFLGSTVGTARAAMRLTSQLTLPFGSLAKLSRENLELLAKLPPANANDPKWADAAESLSDEAFGAMVRQELVTAPSMHIENMSKIAEKVPDSVKKEWDKAKTIASKLHSVTTSEGVVEAIVREFLEAPYHENPAITNEDAYNQIIAAEEEAEAQARRVQKANAVKNNAKKSTATKEKKAKAVKKQKEKTAPKRTKKNKSTDFNPDEIADGKSAAAGDDE